MTADEVLEALKGKINDYYYGELLDWLIIRKKHGLFKTKFKIEPIGTWVALCGYTVMDLHSDESIAVF